MARNSARAAAAPRVGGRRRSGGSKGGSGEAEASKPWVPPPADVGGKVEPTPMLTQQFLREISASDQNRADAGTAHASIYKKAKDNGFNTAALKDTRKIIKMDVVKGQVYLDDLLKYLLHAGFVASSRIEYTQPRLGTGEGGGEDEPVA